MPPLLIAIFGFGHHGTATPAPSVLARAAGALEAVPIGIWVAIIGVAGAVAGPVVAHVLEGRRERARRAKE